VQASRLFDERAGAKRHARRVGGPFEDFENRLREGLRVIGEAAV